MTSDVVSPGDMAGKSKNETLDAHEIYAQKPYYNS